MKRALAIGIALVVCLALAVPVMANGITTEVDITAGGDPPIVKCKWETPDDCDPCYPTYLDECGDPCNTPGTQVLATPGTLDTEGMPVIGVKPVQYWAVVTHELGMDYINKVYADVYHPDAMQLLNLSADPDPSGEWCGSFKYQQRLLEYEAANNSAAIAAFQNAWDTGLVTINEAWAATLPAGVTPYDDIIDELEEGLAEVFMGENTLDNHQPCGTYLVEVVANNINGLFCAPLANDMEFCCLDDFIVDFSVVDYGSVAINVEKPVGGDDLMVGPLNKPTVWNSGNSYLNITVAQDDMGMGESSDGWNVHWAARLGNEDQGTKMSYDPYDAPVTLPELLIMCHPTKMDFFILVEKATQPTYVGEMTLGCVRVPFVPCT